MLKKTAALSFWISLLILLLKWFAYFSTDSKAILSDALESIVNVIAAIVAYFVMRAVAEPADEEHPYGHGKLEYFSSAFEGGLITFAAFAIFIESYRAWSQSAHPGAVDVGLAVMAVAGTLNLALGLWLLSVAKKGRSEALRASGLHVISDVYTTVAVFLGLLLYRWTGWEWIDSALAALVACYLLYTGYKIVRSSIRGLIDEKDPVLLEDLFKVMNQKRKNWLIDVHDLKIIRSGSFHHVDCHVIVPEFWDAIQIHDGTKEFEKAIAESYNFETEFAFHIDPCHRAYCRQCSYENCPVREQEFVSERKLKLEMVTKKQTAHII